MADDVSEGKEARDKRNHLIERIITGALGAVLLALQGVNIGETSGNGELIKRLEIALHQQTEMVSAAKAEGTRVDRALENQSRMLEKLDGMLQNETKMLDLLRHQQQDPDAKH